MVIEDFDDIEADRIMFNANGGFSKGRNSVGLGKKSRKKSVSRNMNKDIGDENEEDFEPTKYQHLVDEIKKEKARECRLMNLKTTLKGL